MKYRIKSLTEKDDDGRSLFWSNKIGWVSIDSSDTFTEKQSKTFRLPVGNCKWVEVGKEFPELRHTASEEQLIKLVELAYGDPIPDTYEQACKHDNGDGLADFIVIELREGTEGSADKIGEAIRVMFRAKRQLDAVLMALEDAQAVGIEKTLEVWSGN